MKILMMTNSYAPMVGGIEQSIRSFTNEFEKLGHQVVIVAPDCEGVPPDETGVIRLRALENFNKSEFSIALPMSSLLPEMMKTFKPDIIHCHHPFWMGDIALRLSSQFRIPLVFTYHTMFEQHMHYLPVQNEGVKRFIIELFTGFANLSHQVIVPSESVRALLLERGVKTSMEVVPTGVDLNKFSRGNKGVLRKRLGIPMNAVVLGYIGRLAEEKNMEFLSRSVASYLKEDEQAHFVVGGGGPSEESVRKIFADAGVDKRLHLVGVLKGQDLVNCYHAMNIYTFASLSETQGIVLVEAMAAGVPVVAIDGPGVREVVKDGYNGRLIFSQEKNDFLAAIQWCLNQPAPALELMKKNAIASTKDFAIELCAKKMLKVYHDVLVKEFTVPDRQSNAWDSLTERLRSEWSMFKNMMQSVGSAMADAPVTKAPMTMRSKPVFLKIPRLLSLSEWSVRLLHLPRVKDAQAEPGLVFIQIDGLSSDQLARAFEGKKMPFLQGLVGNKYYKLFSQYPGLPSSTPSVQGEIFYGVKQAVPAFAFVDRNSGKIFKMYDSEAALEIESRISQQGQGLLAGGSSYSNIYTGGAQESHFCATSLGWSKIWKDANPISLLIITLTQFPSVLRMTALTLWEIILGLVDFARGIIKGEGLKKELNFIYLRALICILLRELVALGARMDIDRGLPIIHLNFLGYDELAHNSGPSSPSAHWSLLGIDRAIEKLYRKALHSPHRSYDVWIYSDHGQEDTVSFAVEQKRSVQEAVAEVFKDFDATADLYPFNSNGEQLHRARFLGLTFIEKLFANTGIAQDLPLEKKLIVTAIGPTGNIYLPHELSQADKHRFAQELVAKAKIPVLMLPEALGRVRVWTEEGEFALPDDAKKILGESHPFLAQVTLDLISLCHHPNAGDFTFMGYKPGVKPMTFPAENGSHAGPGPMETNGFALLPVDIIPKSRSASYLTPMDLRMAAFEFLKRPLEQELTHVPQIMISEKRLVAPETIRIMTYNVHSCVGTDGKISPQRIARVIRRHDPDIIALQELDMGRQRTGGIDQPHLIAKELGMEYHFHPSIAINEERYGNVVLSRYPMEFIRSGRLPGIVKNRLIEPRGVIWSVINVAGIKINFFNTHLGLLPLERLRQTNVLLGKQWIAHPACQGPIILCGDFNALPQSLPCRIIKRTFRDAQELINDHLPTATWRSHYPVGRIDHVFIGPTIDVVHAQVSRSDLDKIASDHLPLIVDICLKKMRPTVEDCSLYPSTIDKGKLTATIQL